MDFRAQFRNGVDRIVAAESLRGDDKSRRHGQSIQIEVFQMVGLVADKHLVVHHGRHLPEGANQHLRVIGHDVADEFRVEGGFHRA